MVLICPATTSGQDDPVENNYGQILAELGDEDYAIRQNATRRLLQNDELTQNDLDRLFVQCETPEQRHRVLRVARHHDIRRMIEARFRDNVGPGSMGLSHAVVQVKTRELDGTLSEPRTGVMAALTLPGFPAYAAMDPGDVIIEFDGQPIPEKIIGQSFQAQIKSKRAGETIRMKVVRNGDVLDIQMTLSISDALREAYDTNGVMLNGLYRQQWIQTREAMVSLLEDEGVAARPDTHTDEPTQ